MITMHRNDFIVSRPTKTLFPWNIIMFDTDYLLSWFKSHTVKVETIQEANLVKADSIASALPSTMMMPVTENTAMIKPKPIDPMVSLMIVLGWL